MATSPISDFSQSMRNPVSASQTHYYNQQTAYQQYQNTNEVFYGQPEESNGTVISNYVENGGYGHPSWFDRGVGNYTQVQNEQNATTGKGFILIFKHKVTLKHKI